MRKITTRRLEVRRFAEEDLADFLAYQRLPAVRQYIGEKPMSNDHAMCFLVKQAKLAEDEKGCYHAFAVYHREDAKVIGDVGFYLEPGPERKGDLGFRFHPAYQGKGYAREASEALIRYGFMELGLSRITSGCDARNVASFGLMERLGMRREAHFRQSRITGGVLHDEYVYALLYGEWMAKQEVAAEGARDDNEQW